MYVSIWNNGESIIETEVLVDLEAMEIVEFVGVPDPQGAKVVPEMGDEWTEQKVVLEDGTEYTAMSAAAFAELDDDEIDDQYDWYGNGVIVY